MLNSPNVRLTPKAKEDIAEILIYLTNELSERAARDFLATLNQALSRLLDHPQLGVQRSYQSPLLQDVRMIPLGKQQSKYLLFYQSKQSEINIIRLIHASRDINALFGTG